MRPLAGELTFLLFSLGIIGTGILAVPVLAESTGTLLSDACNAATTPTTALATLEGAQPTDLRTAAAG